MTDSDEPKRPEKPPIDFKPRRAEEPGQTFSYPEPDGSIRTLTADAEGVVHPKNAGDEAMLDSFDLPIAQKALREDRAAERAAAAAKSREG